MSHFTVMVIGDDVEQQLAPYQENNMGDCPEQYLEFNDQTEYVQECWDELSESERTKYEDMASYADSYHGYRSHDGRFGYWHNPNTKWDGYQIGGRWDGMLLLKPGAKGKHGERSWTNADKPIDASRASQARKGDIDVEGMRDHDGHEAGEKWDIVNPVVALYADAFITWEQCQERSKGPDGKMNWNVAQAMYHAQPVHAAIKAISDNKDHPHREMFLWLSNIERYLVPRAQFVQNARDNAISTFAYLDSTRSPAWVERGEMGWWATVSNEVDPAEWGRRFNEYFDSLPDDTLITIVDCHI